MSVVKEPSEQQGCFQLYKSWTRREVLIILAMSLLDFCGYACVAVMGPFFPLEAGAKGVSRTVTGLIFSSYAFVAFLCAPLWGKVIPRVGPRSVLMAGGVICGLASIGFGFLVWVENTPAFIAACFVVRIAEATGFAAFNTAVFSIVAKMFPESTGTVMAIMEISIGGGLGIGPVIGSGLYSFGGYVAPFAALGALLLASAVLLLLVVPPAKEFESVAKATEVDGRSSWRILKSFSALLVCFSVASDSIGLTYLVPILSIHVAEIGIGEDKAGYMFMIHLGLYAVLALISGHLCDEYPSKRFLMIGTGQLFFAAGHLIIGPSPIFGGIIGNSLETSIIGLLLIGIGSALTLVPTYPALISCAFHMGFSEGIATYALVGGLWNSFCGLGDMVGPFLSATISEAYGIPTSTTVCSALFLLLSCLVLGYQALKIPPAHGESNHQSDQNKLSEMTTGLPSPAASEG